MIQLAEIVPLVIAAVVLCFGASSRIVRVRFPGARVLVAAFLALFLAAVSTVVENLFAASFFDVLEHACRASAGVLVVVACLRLASRGPDRAP